ncbi:MAG: hypothetical protein JOY72_11680 [Actinobacteria bacterium]|nr:hypothetical protein [Actinomycetota bacterium]
MTARARNRAAAVAVLLLVAGLVVATGNATGTFATFIAQDNNQASTFSSSWIAPPTSLGTPSIGGAAHATVSFAWTSGASFTMPNSNPNLVTGQQLLIHDNGASSTCPTSYASGFANEGSALGSAATSTTDNPPNSVTASDYLCYAMESTSTTASPWTSAAFFSAVLLFVPVANGSPATFQKGSSGHAGTLTAGNIITINFNQNVLASSIPVSGGHIDVCAVGGGSGLLFLGDSNNCNNSSDGYSLGKISGLTYSGGKQNFNNSTVSVSGSVVTVTLAGGGQTGTVTGLTTATFVAGTVTSTGSLAACTSTSAPTCTFTTSGSL